MARMYDFDQYSRSRSHLNILCMLSLISNISFFAMLKTFIKWIWLSHNNSEAILKLSIILLLIESSNENGTHETSIENDLSINVEYL